MPPASRPRRLALAAVLGAVLLGTGCTATVAGTPAARPRARPHRGPGQRPGAVGGPGVRLAADVHRPGAGPTAVRRHRRTCRASSRSSPTTSTASSPACSRAAPSSAQVGRSPVGGGDEAVARDQRRADQAGDRHHAPPRPRSTPPTRTTRRPSSPRSPTPRPSSGRSARRTRSPTSARHPGCRRPRRRRRTASSSRRRAATAGLIGAPGTVSNACSTVRPVSPVSQLSLFSAGARPPRPGDLAGLLCGPGQIVRFGSGDQARLSVVLADPGRAPVVVAACAAVGIDAEPAVTESGATARAHRVPPRPRRARPGVDAGARSRPCRRECSSTGPCCACGCWPPAAGTAAGSICCSTRTPRRPTSPLIAAATRAGHLPGPQRPRHRPADHRRPADRGGSWSCSGRRRAGVAPDEWPEAGVRTHG